MKAPHAQTASRKPRTPKARESGPSVPVLFCDFVIPGVETKDIGTFPSLLLKITSTFLL